MANREGRSATSKIFSAKDVENLFPAPTYL